MKPDFSILVATDGSEYSEAAVSHAISLAKDTEAKVTALYVVSEFAGVGRETRVWGDLRKVLEEEGKRALARAKEIAEKEGVKIDTKIVEGSPAEKIIEAAIEGKFDLIVVGTKGKTGLSKFLLGSVAEKVVHGAPCAVTVVRGPSRYTQYLRK